MKTFTLLCLLFLAFFYKSADAQIYIVTEVWSTQSYQLMDSVYVTSPTGVTTSYSITKLLRNVREHDSQLSVIFNSITSLGYTIMYQVPEIDGGSLYAIPTKLRTIYFAKPWTSASSELEQANISQLNIEGFPNPTDGIINLKISYKKGFEPNEIAVINEAGFIVYTKGIEGIESGETVTIDLSNQKSGLYLVAAMNAGYYSALIKVVLQWISELFLKGGAIASPFSVIKVLIFS